MKSTFVALACFAGVWLVTFTVLWLGALLWLHYNHQEVYEFFVPGHSIANQQLEVFYADRRIAMLAVVLASAALSQAAFAIITRKE